MLHTFPVSSQLSFLTGQLPFRVVLNVQDGRPALRIDRGGRLARFQQLDDALDRQDDAALRHVHDHPHGRQRGDEILRVRRPYGDWHGAQIQTPIERADQIEPGREDERDVIARIHLAPLLQQGCYLFRPLVQLGAGERFRDRTLRVEQRVQDVIGRWVCAPSQHTRN